MFYIIAALVLTGCIIQGCFISVEHKKKYISAVVLKGSASVIFCCIGFIGYYLLSASVLNNTDSGFLYKQVELIFKGLVLGAIGDILLNLRFVFEKQGQKVFLAGIAAFLAGHIVYMVSLILVSKTVLVCTICGIVLAVVLLIIIFKSFELKIAFKIFGILYIGAVCLMASYAVGNCITSVFAPAALLYGIGAVLFLISDVVMIFNTFGPTQKFSLRITNLSLYYAGQILIALSLFFMK